MSQLSRRVPLALIIALALIAATAFAGGNERGLDRANLDTTVSPCVDFYQYANGNWLKNNPIPAAYSAWGIDQEMKERNDNLLKSVLETAAADTKAPKGSNQQKIGDFYATAMDTVKIEADGIKPLQPDFDRIAAIASIKDLQNAIDYFHATGDQMLFGADADQDMKNSTQVIAYCVQAGLGMPDRDYYTRTDSNSVVLRDKYVAHVANMLKLLGDKPEDAAAEAKAIMNIETKLAEASLTNVEQRDPYSWYNMVTVAAADKMTPNFSWTEYFKAVGHPEVQQFSYAHPKFFARMDTLLSTVSIADWKAYLRWHLIHQSAPYLGSAYVNENFDFYARTLRGAKELRPRWKRMLDMTSGAMGEALGEVYVAKAFPPKSKERAKEMIENLRVAFKARIQNLPWMSDATKKMAIEKLAAFTPKVGYPDKWRDYSALTIDRSSFVENGRRADEFEFKRRMNKIGKPVDRTEWGMSPQTINAYYNPLMNEIVFPAAMLQPPVFDGDMDDAVNYGAMGAIIGHEMSHGFDDMGCQYDAQGNLKNWWTDTDKKEFDARAEKLVAQFNSYIAIDTIHCNGKLTLGENIGDLGGLLIAYDALQLALKGKSRKDIDGFTPEQRFFLSWAQSWRVNMRPEMERLQTLTNEHSLAKNRTNGPLSDMPEFFKAFGCKDGSQMVRTQQDIVQIW